MKFQYIFSRGREEKKPALFGRESPLAIMVILGWQEEEEKISDKSANIAWNSWPIAHGRWIGLADPRARTRIKGFLHGGTNG